METMEILSVLIAAENKRITGATKAIGQLRKLEESHADLLAALELALQGLEVAAERSPQTGDDAFIGYALAADKARAAIAKAKGAQ